MDWKRLHCSRFFHGLEVRSIFRRCGSDPAGRSTVSRAWDGLRIYFSYLFYRDMEMKTAKIFRHGNSQAVRLPKDFRFDATEVVIEKAGDVVLLIPKRHSATNLKEALDGFKGRIDRVQPDAAEERNW